MRSFYIVAFIKRILLEEKLNAIFAKIVILSTFTFSFGVAMLASAKYSLVFAKASSFIKRFTTATSAASLS